MKQAVIMTVAGLVAASAPAALRTQTVEYQDGAVVLQGYLAYDDEALGKHPGVLVVPDWKGLREHAKKTANRLAQLGCVAFAVDMYGKGVRPQTDQAAAAEAGKYKSNRVLMRTRIRAALEQLTKYGRVDATRVAAIGYCFGGTTVLELARSGAEVVGVVSFHGGLDSPTPADGKNIRGKVLVLHGADDPHNRPADIAAFQNELRHAGVDWQMIYYGGAVHSFTNPEAGNDKSKGVAYDERADRRSWEEMKQFFAEIFK